MAGGVVEDILSFEGNVESVVNREIILLLGLAQDGVHLEEFLETNHGKILKDLAVTGIVNAITDFVRCDPTDQSNVIRIHSDLMASRKILNMLDDAINHGQQAIRELEARDKLEREAGGPHDE